MPQQGAKKKSSTGRIPAHQNTFAFRHNPKSKKTAQILALPVEHCCRRCREKIIWRKTYRKYKPLTQPTICNLCKKRNITAAYHTVCNVCSTEHPQATSLLSAWNVGNDTSSLSPSPVVEANDETVLIPSVPPSNRYTRVCTVCFKQPALPENHESANEEEMASGRPLKLRHIKTMQRQQEKLNSFKTNRSRSKNDEQDDDSDDDSDNSSSSQEEDAAISSNNYSCSSNSNRITIMDEEEDDPFIQAIGGVQNLLVGDAYQTMLLEKHR
jgi:Uncharacterized conserved protein (DUF2039)